MKKLLILISGLLISYPLFYFLGYNNSLVYKIPFGLVAFSSIYFYILSLLTIFKDKSYYKQLHQLVFVVSIIFSIITYETFKNFTFGSNEDQEKQLAQSNTIAIGRVIEIQYFESYSIRRKTIPEHWEIKYEFNDLNNKNYKGLYLSNIMPNIENGDTLTIKYVKDNPEINSQMYKQ